MNISYHWLRTLAPTITDSADKIAERLGMLGAPVDEMTRLGAELGDIVIARVTEVRPHPNADRLRLCMVEAGEPEPLQVVCGAPNVEAGGFYPFAPVGATLPGGMVIRKAKLRGEASEGMLCSARELGLGRDHTGLLPLRGEWSPGTPFVPALELDDVRMLIDITPNRPDLLSHLGVARELAPGGAADVHLNAFRDLAVEVELVAADAGGETAGVTLRIEDTEGCPRYTAAVVRGVTVAPSPEWLATRLRAIGQRPINNIVDATNYVLHELGQPLHAFDLAKLGTQVVVRRARAAERLTTLDGVERELTDEMLVIADADRPVALAGVMGGEETEVSETTTDILLECALFDPGVVRRAARGLGMSTDASYRYERGVDPDLQPLALRRVIDLILAVAGGEVVGAAVDLHPRPAQTVTIPVRLARIERLLGIEVAEREVASLLEPIGFAVTAGAEAGEVAVRVPGARPDVVREVDVIEEIARRRGYDTFEERLLPFRPSNAADDPLGAVVAALHRLFGRWGFLESRTAGFAPGDERRVSLLNPLSSEESHLRDELLPGLLRRVEHNWSHGVHDIRLYEVGTVFFPAEGDALPREELRVAAVATGSRTPEHWSAEEANWDRWDLKALVEELSNLFAESEVRPEAGAPRSTVLEAGDLFRGGDTIEGGLVRRSAIDAPKWAGEVWGVEATLPLQLPKRVIHYRPLPEQPAVERDLALLADRSVAAEAIAEVIRDSAGDLLEALYPFDLYEGKGVPEGVRSIAWRLRFRHAERTLKDQEVDRAIERVLSALDERLHVRRR